MRLIKNRNLEVVQEYRHLQAEYAIDFIPIERNGVVIGKTR